VLTVAIQWVGSFHFLDPSFAETNFGLSPEFRLTNHHGANHCSLHNVITGVIADISVFLRLFVN